MAGRERGSRGRTSAAKLRMDLDIVKVSPYITGRRDLPVEERVAPGRCPICGEGLHAVRLYCPACATAIEGRFRLCRFCQLTQEQRDFLETFLRARGNLREVERELGVSYPTVRARLEAILTSLGIAPPRAGEEEEAERGRRRQQVLDALDTGKITAEDAARLLAQI